MNRVLDTVSKIIFINLVLKLLSNLVKNQAQCDPQDDPKRKRHRQGYNSSPVIKTHWHICLKSIKNSKLAIVNKQQIKNTNLL